jgi:hypothetical protein
MEGPLEVFRQVELTALGSDRAAENILIFIGTLDIQEPKIQGRSSILELV